MNNELKPCKCGKQPTVNVASGADFQGNKNILNIYQILCSSCEIITQPAKDASEAITAWNTRAGDNE